jgi:phage terminase small subunit
MPAPKLNAKQERFAQEVANGQSATAAYELAGYKPSSGNASLLARQQRISKRVGEILAQREKAHTDATEKAVERLALTKEWVLARLMENVERAMQRVAVVGPDGSPTGEYRYDGSVANKALELLGKTRGMFIERHEHGQPGDFDSMSADELRASIARDLAECGQEGLAAALLGGGGTFGGGEKPPGDVVH